MQSRSRLILAVWATAAALVIAAGASAAWLIDRAEREAISEAQERVQRFVSGAEAALNRTLIEVDLLLADMGDMLAPDGVFERDTAQRRLRSVVKRNLEYRDLAVMDADGHVLAAALEQTERLGVPLPQGFARGILAQPAPTMAVSAPVLSFATSERALYFARPLVLGTGRRVLVVAEAANFQPVIFSVTGFK